jgi:hypothetical protein
MNGERVPSEGRKALGVRIWALTIEAESWQIASSAIVALTFLGVLYLLGIFYLNACS